MTVRIAPHKSLICGYGRSLDAALAGMAARRTALRPMTAEDGAAFWGQRAEEGTSRPGLTRLETMMAAALEDCMAGNRRSRRGGGRTGVIFSTTKGNIGLATPQSDASRLTLYETALRATRAAGLEAGPLVICNACISGVAAVIVGSRLIWRGDYDDIYVVGGDEMSRFVTSGFVGFRSVSAGPCLPYDARHDGLSLGEAAGCLMLTNDESLTGCATIGGGALTNDANHISGPSRTGEPLAEAIGRALRQSGMEAEDAAFVNAHGTGTVYNDIMEAKALTLAGLQDVPVNSLKPCMGHTLGASGLVELMVCDDELTRGELLPTLGFASPAPECRLRVSGEAQKVGGGCCVKTASGFGGCNAAVVLLRPDAAGRAQEARPDAGGARLSTVRTVDIGAGRVAVDGSEVLTAAPGTDFGALARQAYRELGRPYPKFFKMDDLCKLGYLGAEYLLATAEADEAARRDMAILLANRSSSLDTDMAYIRQMEAGRPSPSTFVYTLPNIVIGEICIRHHIMGESLFVVLPRRDDEKIRQLAPRVLDLRRSRLVVCGWCEKMGADYDLHMELLKNE